MKKQVIRLTEGDLHRIIRSTVNRILKEDVFDNNNMSMSHSEIDNINYLDIDTVSDNEAVFNASGADGSEYQIYVDYYVSEGMGTIPSRDYDVPDDYDEDKIEIISVSMTKWNDMNEEEEIPYNKNMKFEQELSYQIKEYLSSNNLINNHY